MPTGSLASQILGELLGTALMVFLGNCVCASVTFKRMKANVVGAKWVIIVFGWSLAVFWAWMLATTLGSPGFLNPAVTLFECFNKTLTFSYFAKYISFIFAQFTGAIAAQLLVDFMHWRHIVDETSPSQLLHIHSTAPVYNKEEDKNYKTSFIFEFIGTSLLLIFVLILANTNKFNTNYSGVKGIGVLFLIMSLVFSIGSQTGAALNPARDLGPRIVYRYFLVPKYITDLIKKNNGTKTEQTSELEEKLIAETDFKYGLSVPVLAPCLAAVFVGVVKLIVTLII